MRIILKKTYPQIGAKGEIKEVKNGFARNFLIPQKIALPASDSNIAYIKNIIAQARKKEKSTSTKLEALKEKIKGLKIEIKARADNKGKLFGSVGKKAIQKKIQDKLDLTIPLEKIGLEKAIKKTGEYQVLINVSDKSKIKVKVGVVKKMAKKN